MDEEEKRREERGEERAYCNQNFPTNVASHSLSILLSSVHLITSARVERRD